MYQIIENNNKLYQLIRTVKKEMFTELSHANDYMKHIHCDHVLQNQEYYIFCRNIDDVEPI